MKKITQNIVYIANAGTLILLLSKILWGNMNGFDTWIIATIFIAVIVLKIQSDYRFDQYKKRDESSKEDKIDKIIDKATEIVMKKTTEYGDNSRSMQETDNLNTYKNYILSIEGLTDDQIIHIDNVIQQRFSGRVYKGPQDNLLKEYKKHNP